jgi:hypothetical protein
MPDTYTPRVNESILQGLRAVTDQTVAQQTADAMDYTAAELDDLVGRKVEEAPFSGDALARIVRARRGTARATGQADPYPFETVVQDTARGLWTSPLGTDQGAPVGNRRMAAVGVSDGPGAFSTFTN